MKRIDFFEHVLKRCKQALAKDPSMIPLEWIIDQLEYLIGLEKGVIKDYSNLDKIKIGWIAVREMDGYEDRELIQSLCKTSEEAEKMLLEKKLRNKAKHKD